MALLTKHVLLPKDNWLEESRKWNALTERVQRIRQTFLDAPQYMSADFVGAYTEEWRQSEHLNYLVRKARAVRKALETIPIGIHEGELIVGSQTEHVRGGVAQPWCDAQDLIKQLAQPVVNTAGYGKASTATLNEKTRLSLLEILHWWVGRDMESDTRSILADQGLLASRDDLGEARVFNPSVNTGGQRGGDYEKLLSKGLDWIIAQAKEKMAGLSFTVDDLEKYYFYKAVIIECEGVINWARRYSALAKQMAEDELDAVRKKELERIAEICERVPAQPAQSFYEALQSHWFIHLAQTLEEAFWVVTPGRVDQIWYPYYQRDIEEGVLTPQQAAELVALFVIKLNEVVVIKDSLTRELSMGNLSQYFTLGGQTQDGEDAVNELTFVVLQALGQVRLSQPLVTFRWHGKVYHDALIKALETNRAVKGGIPVFHNDLKKIPDLVAAGVSLRDARDWVIQGCSEASINHSTSEWWINPPVGLAKQLEFALYNGVDPGTGKQLGPSTGDPRSFKTFEEFYRAWEEQFAYSIRICHAIGRAAWAVRAHWGPNILTSALMNDCLLKGRSALEGGARYPQLISVPGLTSGHQNVADSLTAIRKLVFETGQLSMDDIIRACQANFEGSEHVRVRQLLLSAPKYGNDDDEADEMLARIVRFTGEVVTQELSPYGNRCLPPMSPGVSWHYFHGKTVGALPDGRKAFEPLADGTLSPMRGMDRKGPSAVLNSAAKVNLAWRSSVVLNQKFSQSMLASRDSLEKAAALLESYFIRGGYNVQLNIVDLPELLDAKKHPEQHRDLVVRVAGYSAFFVQLTQEVQDEIIARTSQEF